MAGAAPLPLAQLNRISAPAFTAALGEIFENAPWLAEAVADERPFASVSALHDAMLGRLAAAPASVVTAFLNGHPELAGRAARATALGADSAREQAGAGLDRLSAGETAQLAAWNAQYRARFGFPFIICALRHGQESIFAEFARRLVADPDSERRAALDEIARISGLRLARHVVGPGMPKVHGEVAAQLSDTARGHPAAGVPVELHCIARDGAAELLAATITDAEGRPARPLIAGRPVPNGTYELRFDLATYFEAQGAGGFLGLVPVRFATIEPEGRYDIALLFTPWSYTVERRGRRPAD